MSFSYENCTLCARNCGANRINSYGYCQMPQKLYVARAALHMWEEPVISGARGSGTIFFSGCSLRCIYCQNKDISRAISGLEISVERLAEIMTELSAKGAHNINLVTPTHYAPSIKKAVLLAKAQGMNLPIVYNTSSYDSVETLREMKGIVDIYLADMKYYLPRTGKKLSSAENYTPTAKLAISEMVRQTEKLTTDNEGLLTGGTIVRLLVLPTHVAEAKLLLKYLWSNYGEKIYVSIMNQYTPREDLPPPLNRRLTISEYREVVDYAAALGMKRVFVQERESASGSYIPQFDNEGVIKKSD